MFGFPQCIYIPIHFYLNLCFDFLELLHIRLTRPDGSKYEVLSEASLEGRLPPSTWHHLAISVHDSVHGGKVIIEVSALLFIILRLQ